MALYRFFFLDTAGKIVGREELDCTDNETAIATARAKYPGQALEVWSGDQRIAALSGTPAASGEPLFRRSDSTLSEK